MAIVQARVVDSKNNSCMSCVQDKICYADVEAITYFSFHVGTTSERIDDYPILASVNAHFTPYLRVLVFHRNQSSLSPRNCRVTHLSIITAFETSTMKYCGVVYDVGLKFDDSGFSVEPYDENLVKHDLSVIANQLHANAVRIEGEELHRLVSAAKAAHANGLTVFLNPWKMNAGIDETHSYFQDAAQAAEQLRIDGVKLVLVAGCEYSIFSKGVFPGDSFIERVRWFGSQLQEGDHSMTNIPKSVSDKMPKLNEVLQSFANTIRQFYRGTLTYSAGTWETVDWSIFDIVGIDYYRRGETADEYASGLQRYRFEKPVVVMEVGCCAYTGAAIRGDGGFMLLEGVNPDGTGNFQNGVVPTRNEQEQADYLSTQLEILSKSDVHAVFVYVFSFPALRFGEAAKDLDMMSFSLVRTFPQSDSRSKLMPPWATKESFRQVARIFRSYAVATV